MATTVLNGSPDVLIAGAGPVGLTLAIALGQRGVRSIVLERNASSSPWPKMDRTNARSMEMFRRLGIADAVRALGYPPDNPMDVFLLTRMTEPPIAVLEFPPVNECLRQIEACRDASWTREPYQLVAQNDIEPLLRKMALVTGNVEICDGHEVVDYRVIEHRAMDDRQGGAGSGDGAGVEVSVRCSDGRHEVFSASWLVGCDGGSSIVRKRAGIRLEGRGGLRELRQVVFDSPDLYEKIPVGKGRHYNFVDGSVIVAQGSRRQFTLHTALPESADFDAALRRLIGFDCELQIKHVATWRHNLLLAEKYREGPVFLAGDAAHLVIPTGGLGMNSGIGDAIDLAWKLAAVKAGWAGPLLLDSYEQERRPVGAFNVAAAGWAAEGVGIWRGLIGADPAAIDLQDTQTRCRLREAFEVGHGRMHGMRGAEMNYSYAGSAVIAAEQGNTAQWDRDTYAPHVRPGVRLPHMWLSDGTSVQDLGGDGFTFVDLSGHEETAGLVQAFSAIGAPLKVVARDEPHARQVLGRPLLLLRPDLHIAWSGDAMPPDLRSLARRVTGHL